MRNCGKWDKKRIQIAKERMFKSHPSCQKKRNAHRRGRQKADAKTSRFQKRFIRHRFDQAISPTSGA